ncbi:MAG: hypothetical protein ACKVN9_04845 [Methylophilaceae bacterium]
MKNNIFTCLLILTLTGCATPAAIDQMSARKIDTSKIAKQTDLKNNLSIKKVTGGEVTNPMWLSKIDNENFKAALEQSLKAASLLVADKDQGKYLLDVKLVSVEQPFMGLDLKVTATVEYTLEEKSSGKKVFSKKIATPFTATFSDAALAFVRLKIANEGAARENIEAIVDELLKLDIPKDQVSFRN